MTMNADLHLFEDRGDATDGKTFSNVQPKVRCSFKHEGVEHRFYITGTQAHLVKSIFMRQACAYLAGKPQDDVVELGKLPILMEHP